MAQDFLFSENAFFLEKLLQQYKDNPSSINIEWKRFFDQLKNHMLQDEKSSSESFNANHDEYILEEYRSKGFFYANLDPLQLREKDQKPSILLPELATCKHEEYKARAEVYIKNIGAEFSHITDKTERIWLNETLENLLIEQNISQVHAREFFNSLAEIEQFETYLHLKFPGAKRFSIEGTESCILAIEHIVGYAAAQYHTEQVFIGMAHRGRLATLAKILRKPYHAIMSEFMEYPKDIKNFPGDVKYHIGFKANHLINKKIFNETKVEDIQLTLLPNPSHLEAINSVLLGLVRAKQDQKILQNNISRHLAQDHFLGINIHGDSSFCGQGVVAESLMLSRLDAYNAGGIIHIIINNQIGFTTQPTEIRKNQYCTIFGKITDIPIIHVNATDINSVILSSRLALMYRYKFKKDIILDIIGYRKYGHNEGDDPTYTQPIMYRKIQDQKTVSSIYANQSNLSQNEINSTFKTIKTNLEQNYQLAQKNASHDQNINHDYETPIHNKISKTGVKKEYLKKIGAFILQPSSKINVHTKLLNILQKKKDNLLMKNLVDWSVAEQLAIGTLLLQGVNIRLTGQDSSRGTFAQRHAVLVDQKTGKHFVILNNINEIQKELSDLTDFQVITGFFDINNSNLSEYSALAFEYGYSLADLDKSLVIWEAQFGDFANGAQIVIDQFICSGEAKWGQKNKLVLLLPHGYEGQGPDHSSARIERFLNLAAQNNMIIANPTTPAQYFHLLRSQIFNTKPLIIFSPKSLLRYKEINCSLDLLDFGTNFMELIIGEKSCSSEQIDFQDLISTKKIIICSGKIFYDLLNFQKNNLIKTVTIIRIEQLYPFPLEELEKNFNHLIECKSIIKQVVWCQEEPKNMGAWSFLHESLNLLVKNKFKVDLLYIGRQPSASTATGSYYLHQQEQNLLVEDAFKC